LDTCVRSKEQRICLEQRLCLAFAKLTKVSVMTLSSHVAHEPEQLCEELKRLLLTAGFSASDLVEVKPAQVGGHARYLVTVATGKARFALSDALQQILHRPLLGGVWVLCMGDVDAIMDAQTI